MVIFLHGKEKYLVFERCAQLKKAFQKKNPDSVLEGFDLADEFNEKRMKESLSGGGGLFSQKKMVVWKNALSVNSSGQEKIHELIKDFKRKKDEDLILVIAENHSKDERGKLAQYLKKLPQAEKFDFLRPDELKKWIVKKIEEESGGKTKIEDAAAMKMTQTNKSLWEISSEIEKLTNFKENGTIKEKEVDLLCHGSAEAKIFDLVDAVGAKNKREALRLKSQLVSQGENEFYILTMIIFQIKNLLKVSECVKKGDSNVQSISKKLSLHPFVAKKTLFQLSNFSRDQLKRIYDRACDVDLKSKTSDYDMEESLDFFIAKC
jgi:DNA polymerase-3 subunit delta